MAWHDKNPATCGFCGRLFRRHWSQQKHCNDRCRILCSNLHYAPNGCLEWPGTRDNNGYGRIGKRLAHRVAYEAFMGPIPEGLWVLHSCDNPPCIAVEHLFVGTVADNNRDRDRKKRQQRGETHSNAKLTEDDVRMIREICHMGGMTDREVGELFGVTGKAIWGVRARRNWKHI